MKILLVDNGSLEPNAVLALRAVARALSQKVGAEVLPVSLAYADRIAPSDLGGLPAPVVEAFLRAALADGEREFVILPFFVGPSRAVTRALPRLVEKLRAELPASAAAEFSVRIAPALHEPGNKTLAQIVVERVRAAIREHRAASRAGTGAVAAANAGDGRDGPRLEVREPSSRAGDGATPYPRPAWDSSSALRVSDGGGAGVEFSETRFRVALVDHGSPTRAVTQVRDEVAVQLAQLLSGEVAEVVACSMERRPGAEYDFNEPLLETVLAHPEWRAQGRIEGGVSAMDSIASAAGASSTVARASATKEVTAIMAKGTVTAEAVSTAPERGPQPVRSAGESTNGGLGVESITIVAPLFLLPGRHAGPSGDIAQICTRAHTRPSPPPAALAAEISAAVAPAVAISAAEVPSVEISVEGVPAVETCSRERPALPARTASTHRHTLQTEPLGCHPLLIDLLAHHLATELGVFSE